MKKVEFLRFQWYVYLQSKPVALNDIHGTDGEEYDIDVDRKEKFGLHFDGKKYWFMMDDPLDVAFEIDKHNAELLTKNSRGFTGKIGGKVVVKGGDFASLDKKPNGTGPARGDSDKGPKRSGVGVTKVISYVQKSLNARPKPKQVKISLRAVEEDVKFTFGLSHPPSQAIWDMVKEAEPYLGLKIKINTDVVLICESEKVPTALITTFSKKLGRKAIYINLTPSELASISHTGRVDPAQCAAAITHELAHYVYHEAIRNSDLRKWKLEVAALKFHADQYNHGQGYPWHDEHFAMLCEHMVHGHSARRLNSTIGLGIAEKYFDNVFLKGDENSKLYPPKK